MPDNLLADKLKKVLDQERDMLIRGDLPGLETLSAAKDGLLAELDAGTLPPSRLKEIRKLAETNQRLAQAAAEGVRSALLRIAAIRKAAGPIESYGADGGHQTIGAATPRFEKKA